MGGRKCQRCNLSPEEQKEAWNEFDEYLTEQEEEQVIEVMDNYLFYHRDDNGKSRECICTHPDCGRFTMEKKYEKEFFSHTHGEEIKCPVCGGIVTLYSLGRVQNFSTINSKKWKRVTVCRTGADGALLMISGYVRRWFSFNDLRPIPDISWKAKTWLKIGKRMQWLRKPDYDGDCCQWRYKWMAESYVQEPFRPAMWGEGGDSFVIGTDQIAASDMKYSQVEEWYKTSCAVWLDTGDDPVRNVIKYLAAYSAYPTIEMAVKLDMHQAATQLAVDGKKNAKDLNWNASSIQDFLRLNKQDAKEFVNVGGTMELLSGYHIASKQGVTKNMAEYIMLCNKVGGIQNGEKLSDLAIRCGCSIQKAVNYIMKIQGPNRHVMTMWKDYLDMAQTLGYDLSRQDVIMPKDLQQRHDAAAETVKYRMKAADQKKHKALNTRLRKMYEFEYGDMCIVVPCDPDDIIQEGKVLHHCVGGYAARHFDEKLVILFLRHKRRPGVPFMTIELSHRAKKNSPVRLVQIHGYRNENYSPNGGKKPAKPEKKYAWFIDMWTQWLMEGSKRDKQGRPVLPEEKEKSA